MRRKHVPLYRHYIVVDGSDVEYVTGRLDKSGRYYDYAECVAMFDFLEFFRKNVPFLTDGDLMQVVDRFGTAVSHVIDRASANDLYYGQQGVPDTDNSVGPLDTREFLRRFDDVRSFLLGLLNAQESMQLTRDLW